MPDNIIFIYYITISEKIKEFFIKFLHFVLFDDCFVFLPVFTVFAQMISPIPPESVSETGKESRVKLRPMIISQNFVHCKG